MSVHCIFDLWTTDVLAATHDHILDAVQNRNKTILVARGEVAGPKPSAWKEGVGCRLRIIPVLLEDVGSPRHELTWHPRRQFLTSVTHDGNVHDRNGLSTTPWPQTEILPTDADDASSGFRQAEAVPSGSARRGDVSQHLRNGRRAPSTNGHELAHVPFLELLTTDEVQTLRWYTNELCERVFLDEAAGFISIPTLENDVLASNTESLERPSEHSHDMEQRNIYQCPWHRSAASLDCQGSHPRIGQVARGVAMREHNTLGFASGPTCVHNNGGVICIGRRQWIWLRNRAWRHKFRPPLEGHRKTTGPWSHQHDAAKNVQIRWTTQSL
mmetsp:Transcript_16594/g.44911  ORF Transcript_16594/g.44911 Transcript_16594/m.44911 type:complete len:327 (+) Transcript_16594:426-1406(+)